MSLVLYHLDKMLVSGQVDEKMFAVFVGRFMSWIVDDVDIGGD